MIDLILPTPLNDIVEINKFQSVTQWHTWLCTFWASKETHVIISLAGMHHQRRINNSSCKLSKWLELTGHVNLKVGEYDSYKIRRFMLKFENIIWFKIRQEGQPLCQFKLIYIPDWGFELHQQTGSRENPWFCNTSVKRRNQLCILFPQGTYSTSRFTFTWRK